MKKSIKKTAHKEHYNYAEFFDIHFFHKRITGFYFAKTVKRIWLKLYILPNWFFCGNIKRSCVHLLISFLRRLCEKKGGLAKRRKKITRCNIVTYFFIHIERAGALQKHAKVWFVIFVGDGILIRWNMPRAKILLLAPSMWKVYSSSQSAECNALLRTTPE